MKPNLKEGEHFMLIDEFTWDCLKRRYSVKEGQEIVRNGIVVNDETGEAIVELYLKPLLIYPVHAKINFKFDTPRTILASRKDSL